MNVLIATPCYGGLVTERYLSSLLAVLSHREWSVPGVRFQRQALSGESLIPHARNKLAAAFLRSPCDALLFIDADTAFAPRDVDLLLASGKPLVGGACPLKTLPVVANVRDRRGRRVERGALARVDNVGMGFTLIAREVFDRLRSSSPKYRTEHGDAWDFFAPEVVGDSYFGEDFALCNRWTRAGGEVWCHTGVNLGHIGAHEFRFDDGESK